MQQETAQLNVYVDSHNLSNELNPFSKEIDNDVINLLRCDEVLCYVLDDEFHEGSTDEDGKYEMTRRSDMGYREMNPAFDECFCDAGVLWNESSIWSFPHSFLECSMIQESASGETETVGSSSAVLFWGW